MADETKVYPKIQGYSNYEIRDGKVFDIAKGTEVNPNKKRLIAITNDEGALSGINIDDLLKAVAPVSPENAIKKKADFDLTAKEKTQEQIEDEAVQTEFKRLRKVLADASKALTTATKANLTDAYDAFQAAQNALDAYKKLHVSKPSATAAKAPKAAKEVVPPSAEQLKAQEDFDAAKIVFDAAKADLEVKAIALRAFKPVSSGSTGNHAPKMDYRTIQLIRQDIANKVASKDIMEKYGISQSAIGYYRNYLQHKLRRMPEGTDMTVEENRILYTAFTPLINEYYPEWDIWVDSTGANRTGAPYAEDGVKENDDRYTKKIQPSVKA